MRAALQSMRVNQDETVQLKSISKSNNSLLKKRRQKEVKPEQPIREESGEEQSNDIKGQTKHNGDVA
jgi:hypothetical protein